MNFHNKSDDCICQRRVLNHATCISLLDTMILLCFLMNAKNKVTHAKKENKPKILRDGDIYDKSRTIVKNLKD